MANPNSSNVSVAKPKVTGGVARGPIGTALPTDASETLDAELVGLGYVGEGGLTLAMERSSEKFRAWGGAIVHVAQTEFGETYSLTFIESRNGGVLGAVFGDSNVTITPGTPPERDKIVIRHNEQEPDPAVWVFDMRAGGDRRIVIPNGILGEVGEIVYADAELIAYQATIDALPDDSGNCAYEYIG